MRALLVRGGAVWQLVGLITRRSQVQILPPLPFATFCTHLHPNAPTSLAPDGQQRFGLQISDRAVSVVGLPAPLERVDRLSRSMRAAAPAQRWTQSTEETGGRGEDVSTFAGLAVNLRCLTGRP